MLKTVFCITEYGHRDATQKMVNSIVCRESWPPIFVGNDSYPDKLPSIILGAVVFDYENNLGYSANMNRLVKDALKTLSIPIEEIVLFACNNDIEFTKGSIGELSSFACFNNCIVGPTIVTPKEILNPDGHGINPQFMSEDVVATRPMQVEELTMICGACMVMPARIWISVGGFDEDYRIYFGDDQFCIDASRLGYKSFYNPRAVIYHHTGLTEGINHDAIEKARKRFEEKNPGRKADGSGRY